MDKITLSPTVPAVGDNTTITYNINDSNLTGKDIFVHVEFLDSQNNWTNASDIKMTSNNDNTYEAIVPILNKNKICFSFFDNNNKVDNNFGSNYEYIIKNRPKW